MLQGAREVITSSRGDVKGVEKMQSGVRKIAGRGESADLALDHPFARVGHEAAADARRPGRRADEQRRLRGHVGARDDGERGHGDVDDLGRVD